MITALPLKQLTWIFAAFLVLAGALVLGCIAWRTGSLSLGKAIAAIPKIASLAALLALLLGHHKVIDVVWTHVPALNKWVAPNLNGSYQLENKSNWSLKKVMLDALDGNPPGRGNLSTTELFAVTGILTVTMGLWRISMKYEPTHSGTSKSSSSVMAANLRLDPIFDHFDLHYVYKAWSQAPSAGTDSDDHYGAAQLRIERTPSAPQLMSGHYWTNRSWRRGLNTAGEAFAKRIV